MLNILEEGITLLINQKKTRLLFLDWLLDLALLSVSNSKTNVVCSCGRQTSSFLQFMLSSVVIASLTLLSALVSTCILSMSCSSIFDHRKVISWKLSRLLRRLVDGSWGCGWECSLLVALVTDLLAICRIRGQCYGLATDWMTECELNLLFLGMSRFWDRTFARVKDGLVSNFGFIGLGRRCRSSRFGCLSSILF